MPTPHYNSEDEAKLRELILHICLASETDPHFGAVKLNKILFFADFSFFRLHGRAITKAEYQKLPFGPVPRSMPDLLDEMVTMGDLCMVERDRFGKKQKKYIARRNPDYSVFSPQEIAFTDEVIRSLWDSNAKDVSEISHEFIGWKYADLGETIPYGTALLDERELTEEEKKGAAQLDWSGFEEIAA